MPEGRNGNHSNFDQLATPGGKMPGPNGRRSREKDLRVVRMIIVNWIGGAFLGVVFAGALLWVDAGGLGGLILRSSNMVAALALLCGGFALTFASLAAGTAIMMMPKSDEPKDPPSGGHGAVSGELIPVPVVANRR